MLYIEKSNMYNLSKNHWISDFNVNGGGIVKHDILTNLGKLFPYQTARCSLFCPLNQ